MRATRRALRDITLFATRATPWRRQRRRSAVIVIATALLLMPRYAICHTRQRHALCHARQRAQRAVITPHIHATWRDMRYINIATAVIACHVRLFTPPPLRHRLRHACRLPSFTAHSHVTPVISAIRSAAALLPRCHARQRRYHARQPLMLPRRAVYAAAAELPCRSRLCHAFATFSPFRHAIWLR